jgi:hypothetical protein
VVAAATGDADARARVDVVTTDAGFPRATRFARAEPRAWLGAAAANAREDIAPPSPRDGGDAGKRSREKEPRVPSTSRASALSRSLTVKAEHITCGGRGAPVDVADDDDDK